MVFVTGERHPRQQNIPAGRPDPVGLSIGAVDEGAVLEDAEHDASAGISS